MMRSREHVQNGTSTLSSRRVDSTARQNILRLWEGLSDQEKELLLPQLIHTVEGWRRWAFNPYSFLSWLEWKFQQAGVQFPKEARLSEENAHQI